MIINEHDIAEAYGFMDPEDYYLFLNEQSMLEQESETWITTNEPSEN